MNLVASCTKLSTLFVWKRSNHVNLKVSTERVKKMKKISTVEEFEQVVKENNRFLFLKHSTTCPISAAGHEAFSAFASSHEDIPSYYLHVQDSRDVSNYIAETYEVKHESPQALLFEDGKVKWHASHWNINEEELAKNVAH